MSMGQIAIDSAFNFHSASWFSSPKWQLDLKAQLIHEALRDNFTSLNASLRLFSRLNNRKIGLCD